MHCGVPGDIMLANHRAEGKSLLSDGLNKDSKLNLSSYLGNNDDRAIDP